MTPAVAIFPKSESFARNASLTKNELLFVGKNAYRL